MPRRSGVDLAHRASNESRTETGDTLIRLPLPCADEDEHFTCGEVVELAVEHELISRAEAVHRGQKSTDERRVHPCTAD